MKSLVWKVICIPAALFTIGHIEASAEIIIPPGLKPGDTYHLAFVTTGTTNALSPYVDTYNSFVTQQASLPGAVTQGYGVNWYAIASTPTVDARDNVPISGPVYLLNGLLCGQQPSRSVGRHSPVLYRRQSVRRLVCRGCLYGIGTQRHR